MIPDFKITIDGRDLTARFAAIARFTLTDKRAFEADTLTIEIADPADEIALPDKGATIRFAIGYKGVGLEEKGAYIVDGISHDGPPDTIFIYARSANLKETMNSQKSRSFKNNTLGEILNKVAKGQGLTPAINPELAMIDVKHLDQTNESDGHLISRLGRLYGAVATVKDDRLIFTPLSRGSLITGTPMAPTIIKKSDCSTYNYDNSDKTAEFTSVASRYRNLETAETVKVVISAPGKDGGKTKTLPETFADEQEAVSAANAELRRLSDSGTSMSLSLTQGRPALIPESPIMLQGFKEQINQKSWVCDTVRHICDAGGYYTSLDLVLNTTV